MVETIGGVFGSTGEQAANSFFDSLNLGMGRVEGIFTDLSEIVNQAVQPLGQLVAPVFSGIASIISDAMNTALGAISGVTGFISANVMPLIPDLSNIIAPVIEEISGDISDAMSDIFGDTDTAFSGIETLVNEIWPAIADTIKTAVSGVASVVRTVWPVIKNVASTVFNAVKSVVMAVWPVVSSVIKTAVNTAKNVVSTAVGAIKGAFKTFSNIAGTVKNAFNAVKDAITKPIETAKATLKGILDKIKSFFPLNIGKIFSNLQLPRISVNGGTPPFGIGGKGSLPSFNIQWYARGGILDDAALIGAGERGTEFIWPGYDPYMSKYAKAIASNMPNSNGGITVNFTYNGEGDATDAVNLLTSNLRQLRATGAF
jgi:phage-related protein